MLTLVGPGGIGKSRLALQTAALISDEYSDGTYFIPLEVVSSAEFLITAIADALNFHIDTTSIDGTAEEQVLGYLRDRSMLLLLDNFEHVMEAALFLSEILEKAPDTKLMVTSRERLNVKSEWTFDVFGLDRHEQVASEVEGQNSSLTLFLERAQQAKAGFVLLEDQRSHALRICELVEGMPLAIELAASWSRMFSPEGIAREIDSGIEFLASSMKDLPARHRSIQAVLDYSWQLLSDEDKNALMKLSVFQGGFTLSRAKDVANASIAMIADLVDKSHLRKGPEGRYEMHGLSRQYALSKLGENPEEEKDVRAIHASTFAYLLKEWEPELKSGKRGEVLQGFSAEIGNVRAAWDWAIGEIRVDLILNSLESLWLFYEIRNAFQEGFNKFQNAAKSLGKIEGKSHQDLDLLLSKLLARQGWFAWRLGRYPEGQRLVKKSLDLAIEPVSIADQAFSRLILGIVTFAQGELGDAKGFLDESLSQWREIEDRWGIAACLDSLGVVECGLGELNDAKVACLESLEIRKSLGDRRGEATSLNNLSHVAYLKEDYDEAIRYCREGLEIRRDLGNRRGIAASLNFLGALTSALNNHLHAKEYMLESLEIRKDLGDKAGTVDSLNDLGSITLKLEQIDDACDHFKEAFKIATEIGAVPKSLEGLSGLTECFLERGEMEKAVELFSLVAHHEASDQQTKSSAQDRFQTLSEDSGDVSLAQAWKRGSEVRIEDVDEEIFLH
jgi:predicted ATPase